MPVIILINTIGFTPQATSIGYHGNVVDVWERFVVEYEASGELLVELGSDQTSCHNPFGGGYCPVQLSYQEAEEVKGWCYWRLMETYVRFNIP